MPKIIRHSTNVQSLGRHTSALHGEADLIKGRSAVEISNMEAETAIATINNKSKITRINTDRDTKIAKMELDAIGNISTRVAQYAKRKSQENTLDQTKTADLFAAKALSQYTKENAGRTEYTNEEAKQFPGYENETRASIPADEINPLAYRTFSENIFSQASQGIQDENARGNWEKNSQIGLEARMLGEYDNAAVQRKGRLLKDEVNAVEDAIENKEFGIGAALINGAEHMSKDQKHDALAKLGEKKYEYDNSVSTELIESTLLSRNVTHMSRKLVEVTDESIDMSMTVEERRIYADRLRSEIASVQTEEKEKNAYLSAQQDQFVNDVITSLKKSSVVTPAAITKAIKLSDEKKDKSKILTIVRESRIQSGVRNIAVLSETEQEAAISSLKNSAKTPGDVATADEIQERVDAIHTKLKLDPIGTSIDYRLNGILPLDFTDQETLTNSVQRRVQNAALVNKRYGTNVVITKNEAAQFSSTLSKMKSSDEKLAFISTVSNSFGNQATQVFEQMKIENPDGIAFASTLYTTGRTEQATAVLKGLELLKDSNTFGDKALSTAISTRLNEVYRFNEPQRLSALQAVKAYYAYASQGEMPNTDYDSKIFIQSIENTVGKTVYYNDSPILPPFEGGDKAYMSNYMRNVQPSYIRETLGEVEGIDGPVPTEKLLYEIQEGTYKLVQNKHNSYALMDVRNGGYLRNKDGGGFLFRFDENATMKPAKPRKSRKDILGY